MKLLAASCLLLASTSGAFGAPQVALHDPFFSTESSASAQDPVALDIDADMGNVGNNWATAAQNSFTSAWTNAGASANAFGATDGNEWDTGFSLWGYARALGDTAAGQRSLSESTSFTEISMTIQEVSRIKGTLCLMGDATLPGTDVLCVIEHLGDAGSNEVVFEVLMSEGCTPDQQPCPLNCIEFDIPVEPGEYRFWGLAEAFADNVGAGYHEAWAEFSVEINIRGVAAPDLDGDDDVDGNDLAIFLGGWGSSKMALDFNGDTYVNGQDLTILLNAWTN
jgi:hypothetical protein